MKAIGIRRVPTESVTTCINPRAIELRSSNDRMHVLSKLRGAWACALRLQCTAWAVAALAVLCIQPVGAATIPWQPATVSFVAREQPVRDLLVEFFASQGLSVSMSPGVRGTANGTFAGRPEQVFGTIVKGFSLLTYFDGALVHVYSAAEAVSSTIIVPQHLVPRVIRSLHELRMINTSNIVRAVPHEGLIVVSGAKRFVEQAEEVARSIQSPASNGPAVFRVFMLKHAWAHDITLSYSGRQVVIPGLATTLRSLLGSPSRAGLYFDHPDRVLPPTVDKLRGRGLRGIAEQGAQGGARAIDRDVVLQDIGPQTASGAPVAGGDLVRIESDRRLNAVIVRDSKERMPYYEQLIATLDIESLVIEIEATIVDVNNDRLRELGINWRWTNAGNEVLFGRGDESDLRLRPGQDVTPVARGVAISTIFGTHHKYKFVSRITALQTDGAARVTSKPQVITLNNTEAVIENTRTFFVRVPGQFEVDLFNVNSGTTLRVTPHVTRENGKPGRIRMLVNVEDGTITGTSVDAIPIINKAAINTQAIISEGESLLVGGLVRDETSDGVTKIPLLGDIPWLGRLFSYSSKSTTRVERLFLITPRIITSEAVLNEPTGVLRPGAPQDRKELGSGREPEPDRAPGPRRAPAAPSRDESSYLGGP